MYKWATKCCKGIMADTRCVLPIEAGDGPVGQNHPLTLFVFGVAHLSFAVVPVLLSCSEVQCGIYRSTDVPCDVCDGPFICYLIELLVLGWQMNKWIWCIRTMMVIHCDTFHFGDLGSLIFLMHITEFVMCCVWLVVRCHSECLNVLCSAQILIVCVCVLCCCDVLLTNFCLCFYYLFFCCVLFILRWR